MSKQSHAAAPSDAINARQFSFPAQAHAAHSARPIGQRPYGNLTRRQLEVLQFVAQGWTNREIARVLFLSPRTVEMHVADILAQLGCHTRTAAVYKASELSLLMIP